MLNSITLPKNFLKKGKNLSLCENYSRHDDMIEFAILKRDGSQVGDWMRCKDYIQDVVWGSINGIDYTIYGWEFNEHSDSINPNNLILAMRRRSLDKEGTEKILENCSKTIWNLESILGIPTQYRTRFSSVLSIDKYHYFVVYVSRFWMRCIGTVSFITWALRSSVANNGHTWESHLENKSGYDNHSDSYYLNDGKKFIEYIQENGIEALLPDWDRRSVNSVHNNGWVRYASVLKKNNPKSTLMGQSGQPYDNQNDEDEDFIEDEW